MGLRRFLGLEEPEQRKTGGIGVVLTNVTLPLDLALELAFRQQSQVFSEMNVLKSQIAVNAAVIVGQGETMTHLHNDMIELQQRLEMALTHPVDRKGLAEEPEKPDKKKLLN